MRAFAALVWPEFLWYRAYPLQILSLAVSPPLMVAPYILFARLFGVDSELQFSVAVGLILWLWLSNLVWEVGYGVENDMEEGTLESLLVTPVSITTLLAAKSMASLVSALYCSVSALGWMLALGVRLPLDWPLFLTVCFLCGMAMSGFTLLLTSSVLLMKRSENLGQTLLTLLGALSGSTISTELFPTAVWVLSRLIPLSLGIEAARRLLAGQPIGDRLPWLLVSGLVYVAIGRALLRRAEQRMRVTGTTGEF